MRFLQRLKRDKKWAWGLISIVLILGVGLVFPLPKPVSADVAPPQQPPGANLSPANEFTQVRMIEETVVLDVLPETDLTQMGQARVWAEFIMKNLGSESESLLVRFPLSVNDGFFNYPQIEDFRVYVNNQAVVTSPLQMPGEHGDTIQWVHFEVIFPPQEIVEIEVDYTLQGTGEYPFVAYQYLLETGAGWKDTIGSADITVKLPYPATGQTVFIDSSPGWGQTSSGAELKGNQISWYFDNLEPTREDNISVALVWPSAWHKVELEKQKVSLNPNDGEAWGRLGKIYKELIFLRKWMRDDPGGEDLFILSLEAYERSLELLPEDALWHAGLADLLFWKYTNFNFDSREESRDGFVRALEELYIAYTLDPNHPFIKDYVQYYYFPQEALEIVEDEAIFYWLTQTPTLRSPKTTEPSPTYQPTATEAPQDTQPVPTDMPTATPEPPPVDDLSSDKEQSGKKFSLPICGSLILVPFFLVIPLVRRQKI
jgi:hypothetical protein